MHFKRILFEKKPISPIISLENNTYFSIFQAETDRGVIMPAKSKKRESARNKLQVRFEE